MSIHTTIREAFEAALIKGLQGEPLTDKNGAITDEDGQIVLGPPDASFLSVVRAYLKDLSGPTDGTKVPRTGQPREGGLLEQYMQTRGKGLPFNRPQ